MAAQRGESGSTNQWVKLQRPGWNVATIVPLSMILVHLILLGLSWPRGGIAPVFYQWGGLFWGGLSQGRIWQLVSHIWLHGNWLHLGVNVLLFYYAAARLSHFLNGARILGLFLVCGVGSGLAHVMAQVAFPELAGVVGASGGLTGLLLGYFSISPDSRMIFFKVSAGNLAKGILIASGLLFLISPMAGISFLSPLGRSFEAVFGPGVFRAAHSVHLAGGLLGWFLISRFLPPLLTRDDLARMRLEREVHSALR